MDSDLQPAALDLTLPRGADGASSPLWMVEAQFLHVEEAVGQAEALLRSLFPPGTGEDNTPGQ